MAAKTQSPRRRKKKPKWKVDPQKLEQLRQKRKLRGLFTRIGFTSIKSNDIEFAFEGRTGEIDEIFVQENILLVCEYTIGKPSSEHISKKSILFSKIDKNPSGWIAHYASVNSEFKKIIETSEYAEK